MSGGLTALAAVVIVLFTGFVVLDLTGNIDWGGAGLYWSEYQFLVYPLLVFIVAFAVIAYGVRKI